MVQRYRVSQYPQIPHLGYFREIKQFGENFFFPFISKHRISPLTGQTLNIFDIHFLMPRTLSLVSSLHPQIFLLLAMPTLLSHDLSIISAIFPIAEKLTAALSVFLVQSSLKATSILQCSWFSMDQCDLTEWRMSSGSAGSDVM